MLTYQFCKRLKKAGFPQKSRGSVYPSTYYENNGKKLKYRHIENDEGVKIPTLSELIKATPKISTIIRQTDPNTRENFWLAEAVDYPAVGGKTPEEAVAKLYLKLKEK